MLFYVIYPSIHTHKWKLINYSKAYNEITAEITLDVLVRRVVWSRAAHGLEYILA